MSRTEVSRPSTTSSSEYARQAEKLSLESGHDSQQEGHAVDAIFITPLDPVVQTADGNRLPAVPVDEAHKINLLKDEKDGRTSPRERTRPRGMSRFDRINRGTNGSLQSQELRDSNAHDGKLGNAIPPSRTHPLFPPLPLYGPTSTLRDLQCFSFRVTSFFLSTGFLLVIVLGAVFTSIPKLASLVWSWITFRDPTRKRPFHQEEKQRAAVRKEKERRWIEGTKQRKNRNTGFQTPEKYAPLEGGPDPLICDASYYARRVGLDLEEFKVQTEDGFIITLWHIYDPKEYVPAPAKKRRASSPEVFTHNSGANGAAKTHNFVSSQYNDGQRRYPVLLMHGLLQSAGAYCVNDDDSLAFLLHKSGYDVWLGNNRCGFNPEHSLLKYSDPRTWAWNIRQMGVMDLTALISRVLEETGFPRLGLVCHSQGTTQTFVALAKEQRPDLGEKISVFCALAPAVYAGPLIGKMYFKFMHVISPSMFRIFFGIHSFIPLMMTMHSTLPGWLYGAMGYRVFSFLFNWSDARWDRGLRDRFFMFSPVYVSSESMRWWLGRECFAKHKCVLSTKEEGELEDEEDEESEDDNVPDGVDSQKLERAEEEESNKKREDREQTAWYSKQVPPMAMWIAGSDELVDGRRLLRRFERGREPNVNLVYSRVIPEYEHLDVLWAMDAVEKVAVEVREVIWNCMNAEERRLCRRVDGVCDENNTEKKARVREQEIQV